MVKFIWLTDLWATVASASGYAVGEAEYAQACGFAFVVVTRDGWY